MSELLNQDQLCERWGKTRGALAQMRYRGDGPKFVKIGKSVFYRVQDILEFEESQIRTRTDDLPNEAA